MERIEYERKTALLKVKPQTFKLYEAKTAYHVWKLQKSGSEASIPRGTLKEESSSTSE